MNNEEKVLAFTLGRKITIYDIGRKLYPDLDPSQRPSKTGTLYTAKKQLLGKKLIIDFKNEGRNSPITADVSKYLTYILKGLKNKRSFKAENKPLFEKYASRVVDFLEKEQLLDNEYDLSYPFIFFMLSRYLMTISRYLPKATSSQTIDKIHLFMDELNEEGKEELLFAERKEEMLRAILILTPPKLFKEVFMELGVKFFDSLSILKEVFDYILSPYEDEAFRDRIITIQSVIEDVREGFFEKWEAQAKKEFDDFMKTDKPPKDWQKKLVGKKQRIMKGKTKKSD